MFNTQGRDIIWNGNIFVAVGDDTRGYTILNSMDGIAWNRSLGSSFSQFGVGVCWNESIFVAVGGPYPNTILTSTDGVTWSPIPDPTQGFDNLGKKVSWNGERFVAVGRGSNSRTIITSTDGINWIPGTGVLFTFQGNDVTWDGSKWIAVGQGANDRLILTSTDGIVWSNSGITGGFTRGDGALGGQGVSSTNVWKKIPVSTTDAINKISNSISKYLGILI
jgi:hypothetical protein